MEQKRVLFVGQCFYNTWYLSRELRKIGWKADVLNIDVDHRYDMFYHGEDFRLSYERGQNYGDVFFDLLDHLIFFFNAIDRYDIFHFTGIHRLTFSGHLQYLGKMQMNSETKMKSLLAHLVVKVLKIGNNLRAFDYVKFLPYDIKLKVISLVIKQYGIDNLDAGWEINLLRKKGKKVVYTQTGCLDGVSQTSFSNWDGESACPDCVWSNRPEVCSDKSNLSWGIFRNEKTDYQVTLGGNRVDCNLVDTIHEIPEFYCLDPVFWNPNLLIPTNFRLQIPVSTVKIYHAVGDFESRSHDKKNIKSTHIYFEVVEKLKREGFPVELIFFNNVPNKDLRFYQVQADIVVDMLKFGWFGANVREAMMLGKPVICYLRPEWLEQVRREMPEYVDEMPIISATENTVYDIIKELVVNKQKLLEIGKKSREFAIKWHSSEAGAKRMSKIYEGLFGNNDRKL